MIGLVHELAPDVICKAASKHIRMTGLHIKQNRRVHSDRTDVQETNRSFKHELS